MLSKVKGSTIVGTEAHAVQVEVDITSGLPAFEIVGLPDAGLRESRVRVKSAVRNSGFEFPNRRIHVNLAPADIRKEGPAFDLPIALGVLEASGQASIGRFPTFMVAGELSLDGRLREVTGALSIALCARRDKAPFIVIPEQNSREAGLVEGVDVYGLSSLRQAVRFLEGEDVAPPVFVDPGQILDAEPAHAADLVEVKGQEAAKRALEVAAAGGHNLLLVGPPGSGKTMLARRLPGILPALSIPEALEVTGVHSVAGMLPPGGSLVTQRPFRSPHCTTSTAGLVGGGAPRPRPGEVSLAHRGVLYLDELTLFSRSALDSLRGPMEDGVVVIVRAMTRVSYPARFCLVASMNPCPCGHLGDTVRSCRCTEGEIQRYRSRVSGPMLDRIDIQVEVPRLTREQLQRRTKGESTAEMRRRVQHARTGQVERFDGSATGCNADMDNRRAEKACDLPGDAERFLGAAIDRMGLSARSYHRVLKVARTVADLAGHQRVEVEDLAEAVQYRCLERRYTSF